MRTKIIHELTFDTDDSIMAATLSKPDEVVMLMSSGSVIRFNIENRKGEYLFSVNSNLAYSDGGFDVTAKSSIYTLDQIVVVVNDYKTHGYVHYPDKYTSLHLQREDYYARISTYPIAFYKDSSQVPHLVFGQAWNHVQIMNLDSRQILTASKSLIEENAEERHLEFYKTYKEDNKLPWPSRYNYFFGKLKVSPDNKYFLSEGWHWGSSDLYTIYEIDNFIKSNRISPIVVGGWEHLNRAACWIDEQTLAFGYNPFAEDDNGIDFKIGSEIHFSEFTDKKAENKIVKTEGINTVSSEMRFSKQLNAIIVIAKEIGIAVISLTGEILFQNDDFKANDYYPDINLFLTIGDKKIIVNTLAQ